MTTIDIRSGVQEVDTIIVGDKSNTSYVADSLERTAVGFDLSDTEEGRTLRVSDRQQAENLIKGLQKAIELGWV